MQKTLDTGKYINPIGLVSRKVNGTYLWGNSDSEESYRSYTLDPRSKRYDPIEYRFNSQGHRTDLEIEDLKEYILSVGCSWTEGEGVPQDKRYTELLANELDLQCYCLGINGISNDLIMYNLEKWLSIVKVKPKLIIVQWTFANRYSLISDAEQPWNPIQTVGPWRNDLWSKLKYSQEFLIGGDYLHYWKQLRDQYSSISATLCKEMNIPLIQTSTEKTKDFIVLESFDLGRDQMHPGIESNNIWAQRIKQKL